MMEIFLFLVMMSPIIILVLSAFIKSSLAISINSGFKIKSLDKIKREYQANYIWACETFGVNVFNKDINKPMNSDYWIWSNVSWIVESRTHVQRYYPYNLKFPKCKIGDTSCNDDSSIPSWTKDFMIEFNQICDDMKNRITPEDLALYKKYGVSYKNIFKD